MPQIRPISDLRNTNEISEMCHESQEPIYITKNGYGDLVVMSIEAYERQLILTDIYKKLVVAEAQVSGGMGLLEGEEVFKKLRDKYVSK